MRRVAGVVQVNLVIQIQGLGYRSSCRVERRLTTYMRHPEAVALMPWLSPLPNSVPQYPIRVSNKLSSTPSSWCHHPRPMELVFVMLVSSFRVFSRQSIPGKAILSVHRSWHSWLYSLTRAPPHQSPSSNNLGHLYSISVLHMVQVYDIVLHL